MLYSLSSIASASLFKPLSPFYRTRRPTASEARILRFEALDKARVGGAEGAEGADGAEGTEGAEGAEGAEGTEVITEVISAVIKIFKRVITNHLHQAQSD